MKVLINGKIYDANNEIIGIRLTKMQKKTINEMSDDNDVLVVGPNDTRMEALKEIADILKPDEEVINGNKKT